MYLREPDTSQETNGQKLESIPVTHTSIDPVNILIYCYNKKRIGTRKYSSGCIEKAKHYLNKRFVAFPLVYHLTKKNASLNTGAC